MLFPLSQRVAHPPRVVITGVGIITSLGRGWKANAEGFRAGRVARGPVTLFDVSRQRVKVASEVTLPEQFPASHLTARDTRRMDRASKILLVAALDAWEQSGWEVTRDLPIVLGTTSGGMGLGELYYRQAIQFPLDTRKQPTRAVYYQSQRQALDLADAFGFSGPINIIANACAAGANAIGHAWDLIRSGRSERVLTGGYDGLSQLVFAGFDSLQALSPTVCRPFDAHRDGLALGEGAAILTLETLESARKRGAEIIAEISGYGACTDVHHLTQPQPEGNAAFTSMSRACATAGITPEKIGYLNAHGTGTPLNDSAEAGAINRWAGNDVSKILVSSTKASIGHLLGAAGAVETVVCAMALREGWLPPTCALEELDPIARFSFVNKSVDQRIEYALTNSFGFGGANASLVLRRWE